MAEIESQLAMISSGLQPSTAIDSRRGVAYGLQMPAAFTGTTITFQVSIDGSTFQALYDATGATQVSMAVAASRSYDLPAELTAWAMFKIVSGSAEAADRALLVVGKRP